MKKKFHKEWNFFIFILPLLGATSLQLHFMSTRLDKFIKQAMETGIAPCDRGCLRRAKCKNERLACEPFARWVETGGRVLPRETRPPNKVIFRKLFKNDEQQSEGQGRRTGSRKVAQR